MTHVGVRGIRAGFVILLFLAALGLSVAYVSAASISRPVPASITLNILPIQASADVNADGIVDFRDLLAVTRALDTHPAPGAAEDVNHDGVVDVADLAVVALYQGQEVPA